MIAVLPLMQGEAESIQLRLESRQPLFEAWIVVHRGIANDDTQILLICIPVYSVPPRVSGVFREDS